MSEYIITQTKQFEDDLKFYVKKKKCKTLINEIRELKTELIKGNFIGEEISGVGLPSDERSYKIRMADTTHKIGKRGGFRIIYYVIKNDCDIFLLTIYHKRDKDNMPTNELKNIIKECHI
jgi:mRNA-degrading endonuclease RelE of RelBE toxin-antitoxin system